MSEISPDPSTNTAPLRVLLIDDDEASFHIVRGYLKNARDVRFTVEWCDSSDAALDEVTGQRHDVYLVDFKLGVPPRTGIDLIREARAAGGTAPMILLTGQGDHEVDLEATRAGAADYLDKADLTPALLERSIRFALHRVTAQKQTVETMRAASEELEAQVLERTLALRRANEALEAENAERTSAERELARANAELARFVGRLERSNGELQEFASIASHDLQEPLRKVQTFAQLIKESAGDGLDEEARDALERVLDAAGRMRTLIDDLLALARVNTKTRIFTPVDLSRTAEEVLADLETRLAETGGRVDVGDLGTIEADPTQMRQLLQNLIGNAIKFHRAGQAPAIVVRGEALPSQDPNAGPGGGRLRLTVTDQGIGFDEKYLDRIFGAFQRLHGRSRYEGTGIGLAICRKIAERHGGQITARSAPDKGAIFLVTLPVRQQREDIA
jgi:signal transduction histidine kinase